MYTHLMLRFFLRSIFQYSVEAKRTQYGKQWTKIQREQLANSPAHIIAQIAKYKKLQKGHDADILMERIRTRGCKDGKRRSSITGRCRGALKRRKSSSLRTSVVTKARSRSRSRSQPRSRSRSRSRSQPRSRSRSPSVIFVSSRSPSK